MPLQVYVEGFLAEICDVHAQGFQAVYGSAGCAASFLPCLCGAPLAEETGPRACYHAALLPKVQQRTDEHLSGSSKEMGKVSLICCKVSEVSCLKPDADHPGPARAFHELGKIGTVGRAREPLSVFRTGLA